MTAAAAFALRLGSLVGYWPLGETSGDAIDGSGNGNDGTVTIAAGARAQAALDKDGDGSIEFDGAATIIEVADDAAIQDIFDGGGSALFMFDADSDGEFDQGVIVEKATGASRWWIRIRDESGGNVRIRFESVWSITIGVWDTAVDVPINTTIVGVLTYDADAVGNNPIVYLWDGNALTTRIVGDGLTESTGPPDGTHTSDVGLPVQIGNRQVGNRTFDGHIDEIMLFSATLTEAEARELIHLAREGLDTETFAIRRHRRRGQ